MKHDIILGGESMKTLLFINFTGRWTSRYPAITAIMTLTFPLGFYQIE